MYDEDFYHHDEPDGYCQDCGMDLDEDPLGDHDEHHRQCWRCWRGDSGGKPPEIEPTIADHRFARLLERVGDLERRVEHLEQRKGAAA